MSASADVLALANAEFDIGEIPAGQGITVKWRGKPIFIRHRTKAEIDKEAAVSMNELRDQETDSERALKPEWCVAWRACRGVVGVGRRSVAADRFSVDPLIGGLPDLTWHL
jgi:ubiquinol-cytochrome c reductase iron-sulfur subunit